MTSKLSVHISDFRHEQTFDWLAAAQPKVVKVHWFDSDVNLKRIQQETGALLIFRPGYGDGDNNPNVLSVARALQVIDACRAKREWPKGTVWEGLNEPYLDSVEAAEKLNAWYVAFAKELHARGEKCAAFSFSSGNPTPQNLKYLAALTDALGAADYVALHEYQANFGYYRQVWNALPVKKPLLITECGYDLGGQPLDGWQKHLSEADYLAMLERYDAELMQDAYVLGATIFQLGDVYEWRWFDIDKIMPQLVSYIRAQGGGYPPVWSAPSPPAPPAPETLGQPLSDTELAALVTGWPDPVTAVAIMLAESGGNPLASNASVPGNVDRGLWQISSKWHPEVSNAEAYDPVRATEAAYRISKQGTDFSPWAVYLAGTYERFLERARAAVRPDWQAQVMTAIADIERALARLKNLQGVSR